MKFRLDRMVSLGAARFTSSRRRAPSPGRLPILMYHGINDRLGTRHPYFELNTSVAVFRDQLQTLSARGYRTVNLEGPLSLTASEDATADRKVAITFDDGFADFYDNALPILAEFGFAAIVYVVTSFTKDQRLSKDGATFMSWPEVRELPRYGVRVGSHTVSHCKLYKMSRQQASEEVRCSKETLEDKLGAPVTSFAYPYAFPEHDKEYVAFIRECLQMYGYENAVSTIIGTVGMQNDPYRLPRLPVNTFDDDALLHAKLDGGYEWLHALQYAKKLIR
jgi:peptidoglycan/xylan/chitin deacetylase (PgdA/CDA1 family)